MSSITKYYVSRVHIVMITDINIIFDLEMRSYDKMMYRSNRDVIDRLYYTGAHTTPAPCIK